jgi:hypothetical protein
MHHQILLSLPQEEDQFTWCNNLAGLTDLKGVVDVTSINGSTGGTD